MFTEARLVTPQGTTIILSPLEYQKVSEALALRPLTFVRPSLAEARTLVNELRGKYAGRPSLTTALREERRQEREREEAKARRHARRS